MAAIRYVAAKIINAMNGIGSVKNQSRMNVALPWSPAI
jgi:hypothetical protein